MISLTKESVVLEIGSGSNPWRRSDVLLDRYYVDETGQRGGTAIFRDRRPMIVAAGERLPFKDKAFDFVYSCHVVEHAEDIASMLREMSRVAKAGFIECPNPLLEKVLDQAQHNWYISNVDGKLLIARKDHGTNITEREDRFYFHMMSDHYIVRHNWDSFVTRLYWNEEIKFEICDNVREVFDHQLIAGNLPESLRRRLRAVLFRAWIDAQKELLLSRIGGMRGGQALKKMVRALRDFRRRRHPPRIGPERFGQLLACPYCRGDVVLQCDHYRCVACDRSFPVTDGVAVLL